MSDFINANPDKVMTSITGWLTNAVPTTGELRLGYSQYLRTGAPDREKAVECYYRCILTDRLQGEFGLSAEALPTCINSSHVATRRVCVAKKSHQHSDVSHERWKHGWAALRHEYKREIDLRDDTGHLRRADLHVVADKKIVSLEFKYVGGGGVKNASALAKQLEPYRRYHAATRLVLYSGTPRGTELPGLARLTALVPPGLLVVLHGPAVARAGV
jgi:hypothetical protein